MKKCTRRYHWRTAFPYIITKLVRDAQTWLFIHEKFEIHPFWEKKSKFLYFMYQNILAKVCPWHSLWFGGAQRVLNGKPSWFYSSFYGIQDLMSHFYHFMGVPEEHQRFTENHFNDKFCSDLILQKWNIAVGHKILKGKWSTALLNVVFWF